MFASPEADQTQRLSGHTIANPVQLSSLVEQLLSPARSGKIAVRPGADTGSTEHACDEKAARRAISVGDNPRECLTPSAEDNADGFEQLAKMWFRYA